MADEPDNGQGRDSSFTRTLVKKALAPLVTAAVSAAAAHLARKASELLQERVLPKVEEKGGGRAAARELLENAADKVGGSEKLEALADSVGGDRPASKGAKSSSTSDDHMAEERRQREQRRRQRRRALEQTGSS